MSARMSFGGRPHPLWEGPAARTSWRVLGCPVPLLWPHADRSAADTGGDAAVLPRGLRTARHSASGDSGNDYVSPGLETLRSAGVRARVLPGLPLQRRDPAEDSSGADARGGLRNGRVPLEDGASGVGGRRVGSVQQSCGPGAVPGVSCQDRDAGIHPRDRRPVRAPRRMDGPGAPARPAGWAQEASALGAARWGGWFCLSRMPALWGSGSSETLGTPSSFRPTCTTSRPRPRDSSWRNPDGGQCASFSSVS